MAEKFDLFRLSLTERSTQEDLFLDSIPNREEYLRKLFATNFQFSHYGNTLHYVVQDPNANGRIIAMVGRVYATDENTPPEEGFKQAIHQGWKAAIFVLDPTHHADGQKISFHHDQLVGRPSSLIRSIVNAFNENSLAPYHIEVEPIFSAKSFWEFAESNKGEITSLTFEFVTPNMFGGSDEVTNELRNFRDIEKAQKVTVKIQSSDGLETNTEKVKESVDYVTKGAGTITAKARGGQQYNSTKQSQQVTLPDTLSKESLVDRVRQNIGRLLGRE